MILVIGGLDPSGGAGLVADVQAATALGVHPASVATLVTVQDTGKLVRVEPLAAELVLAQAQAVLSDMAVRAIKLGALGTAATGRELAQLLRTRPDIPLVTDPVLVATSGGALAEEPLRAVYRDELFPLSDVATPNSTEFAALGGETVFADLLRRGLGSCIVTGGEGSGPRVRHLVMRDGQSRNFDAGARLAGRFRGTGCSFATAIAAGLARGDSLETALAAAEAFVRRTLAQAIAPGRGPAVPGRW